MTGNKNSPQQNNTEAAKLAESLLTYPSLEKLFAADQEQNLLAFKENMNLKIRELERIILRGTKEEADKASKIARAFQLTLDLVVELENLRNGQASE